MKLTTYQRLADRLIGNDVDLVTWVLEQHEEEVPAAVIARKLAERTDGEVEVSGQSIRNWIQQFAAESAGAA